MSRAQVWRRHQINARLTGRFSSIEKRGRRECHRAVAHRCATSFCLVNFMLVTRRLTFRDGRGTMLFLEREGDIESVTYSRTLNIKIKFLFGESCQLFTIDLWISVSFCLAYFHFRCPLICAMTSFSYYLVFNCLRNEFRMLFLYKIGSQCSWNVSKYITFEDSIDGRWCFSKIRESLMIEWILNKDKLGAKVEAELDVSRTTVPSEEIGEEKDRRKDSMVQVHFWMEL